MQIRRIAAIAVTAGALFTAAGCGQLTATGRTLGVSQATAEGACRSTLNQRLNEAADQYPNVLMSVNTPTFYEHTRSAGTWAFTGEVHVDLSVVLASTSRTVTFKCTVDQQGRADAYTAGLN